MCVFVNDIVDKYVIVDMVVLGIKVILLCCVGFNNVDFDVVKEYNIKVCCVFVYSLEVVVEYCIVFMLMFNWKIYKVFNWVCEGNFDLNGLLGFNLFKKIIGIIGCGKIGLVLVNILNGFGVKVFVCDLMVGEGFYILCDLDILFI